MPDWVPAYGYVSDYLAFWAAFVASACVAVVFVRRVRREQAGRGRLLAGNVLVLLALACGAALAGETYFRYFHDVSNAQGPTLTNHAWFKRHWDPTLNSLEFRDVEWSPGKPPGTRRTIFLGDSLTAGYGVRDPEDRFGNLVRTELERREPGRHDVWVVASIGWSTGDELNWVRATIERARFDHVVLCYSLNDVNDLLPTDEDRRRRDAFEASPPTWLNPTSSFLLDWMRFRLERSDKSAALAAYLDWEMSVYDEPELWPRQVRRLRELAEICRRAGARLDVAVFPLLAHWGPEYPHGGVHEKLAGVLAGTDVGFLDLRAAYGDRTRDDLAVSAYDTHPNETAHDLVAKAVLDAFFTSDARPRPPR